jgi:hypothetical protein
MNPERVSSRVDGGRDARPFDVAQGRLTTGMVAGATVDARLSRTPNS